MDFYRKLPNEIKAGISTAIITFIALVLGQLTGVLQEVQDWANDNSDPIDISAQLRVIVSGAVALGVGVVNTLLRWAQRKLKLGEGPQYKSE